MVWRTFTFFALLISIAALLVAILAYQRSGGDLEDLRQVVHSTRRQTANTLNKLEDFVRGYKQENVEKLPKGK